MTIRFNTRWLLVPAFLLSLQLSSQLCRAQVDVPPTISFDLGDSNSPNAALWDLGGDYHADLLLEQPDGAEVSVGLSFTLVQDGKGHLSSPPHINNTYDMEYGDNSVFAVLPRVKGKVTTSSPGIARVHLSIHVSGEGQLAGRTVNSLSGSFTLDAETDPTTGDLVASRTAKVSLDFGGQGHAHGKVFDFDISTPQGANSTWTLTLQPAVLHRINGTGTITTPSRVLGLDLGGAFGSGVLKIRATGANNVPNAQDGRGCKAKIVVTSPFDSLDTLFLNGKILGQRVTVP